MFGTNERLAEIYKAWSQQDKDEFRALMCEVFQKREEINIDEDFEEWAYKFIVTEGASDCPPG
jgi:hypothetical protein